jgi:hypothetical protein
MSKTINLLTQTLVTACKTTKKDVHQSQAYPTSISFKFSTKTLHFPKAGSLI